MKDISMKPGRVPFSVVSFGTPFVLLLGIVTAMGLIHSPQLTAPTAMQDGDCIAPQLKSPRFAGVWAITLHNQYTTAQAYRKAWGTASTQTGQDSFRQRYREAAAEYNRMASEAPPRVFQSLPQPHALPE